MELKEAMELLKEMKNNCLIKRDYIDEKAEKKAQAIETVLQALEKLQKENERLKVENIKQSIYENQRNIMPELLKGENNE